ncbi:MAG TPA: hypothetical protein VGO56_17060 [Pyrinomonadaceae bacterium]|jgi:hypothetical protein|nr:hypothetical protein [Pyrinomonadaceae bacterium]
MKSEHLKSVILENKQRLGAALLFLVCLTVFVLTSGAAQLKDQRHVTAIQLGGAAEGSRVMVVSDAPLLDYEAFRRGDRFYVKIPLADLSSAAPHFRADGFDDVQVQRVGDSLIVSFKLQPGATARVDQRGNRLDVVFSAPIRNGSVRTGSAQSFGNQGRDTAGPLPQDVASASRDRIVAERAGSVNESQGPGDPRWPTLPRNTSTKNSNKAGNAQLIAATPSASPRSTPASVLSPAPSSSYQPLTSTTPAASSSPSANSSAAGSSGSLAWRNRLDAARRWVLANRLATLLGVLILLSLIVYLVAAIRRSRETDPKAKQAKSPKVQPRYAPDAELNELPKSRDEGTASPKQSAAAAVQSSSAILTRPTIVSATNSHDEHSSEEEEREVFEL